MNKLYFTLILFLLTIVAFAQLPGSLDLSFGTTGIVTNFVRNYDGANAVALQIDGKIIAVGHAGAYQTYPVFGVARYNTNGSLDVSFGTGGSAITFIGVGGAVAQGVALQTDGKIVVAGYTNNNIKDDFALVRYNTNGTVDTNFGTGGIIITPNVRPSRFFAVAIQTDGKIVAMGTSYNVPYDSPAIIRYNTNGSLDSTFGTGGIAITSIGSSYTDIYAGTIQTDGKIVIAGSNYVTGGGHANFIVARYNTDGSLDSAFGTGGVTLTYFADAAWANAVALEGDGKIVAAGLSFSNISFTLVRYNTNGTVDTTFGSGGNVITATQTNSGAAAVVIQPDGKIIAAGSGGIGSGSDFAIIRYDTTGSLDTTFGIGGIVTTLIGSSVGANAVIIQTDGKIIAVGTGIPNYSSHNEFVVVRYNGDGMVGIEDAFRSDLIRIYPSPATNQLTIDSKQFTKGEVEIYIYDIVGKQVSREIKSKSQTMEIDVSNLRQGIYVIKIYTNNDLYKAIKFIKEK